MRSTRRAARAHAAGRAWHELLAVEQVDIPARVGRRTSPCTGTLDRADTIELPTNAQETVAERRAVAEVQLRFDAMIGWDLDPDLLRELADEAIDLRVTDAVHECRRDRRDGARR